MTTNLLLQSCPYVQKRAVSLMLAALSFCSFGSALQRFVKSGDFTFGHSTLERYFAAPNEI